LKPNFLLVNWSNGSVLGVADTETEAREQLAKSSKGERYLDTYIIAEVRVLSEMKRVES
jgi:hypothetical protein